MRYKKIMMLTIFLTCLLAVSAVNAVENATDDIISADNNNDGQVVEQVNEETIRLTDDEITLSGNKIDGESEFNITQKELLSQTNDEELGLTKTQISVSNYSVTLNPTSTYFTITKLSAKVTTTSGNSISKGGVYFVINQNSYNKIKTFDIGVEKGIASFDFGYKVYYSPGKYKCAAYYSDLSNTYESSSCEFYLTVKTRTELTVKDIQCNIGDTIAINPSIKSATGSAASGYGEFVFIINSERYAVGNSLSLTMNTPGKLKCSAKYVGKSYYLNSSEITFYINVKDNTNIVYSLDSEKVLAGDNININYRVIDGRENTIYKGSVKITESTPLLMASYYYNNLPSYSTSGYVSLTSPKEPGQYTYAIIFEKTSLYQGSSKRFNINVYSKSIIACALIKSHVGKTAKINIIVKDHLGQDINEGIVKSTINGKKYSANVKNGKAIFNNVKMPLNAKTFYYTATYSTDSGLYNDSQCTIKIICSHESKVKVKSITGYAGKKVKLHATVKDGLGNKIKKGTIKFKINGKTYKAKVKNGKVTIKIKLPTAKVSNKITKTSGNTRTVTTYYKSTYLCTAIFGGYKKYPSSSSKFKVISKKKSKTYSYKVVKKKSKSKSSKSSKTSINYINKGEYRFWFNYEGHTFGNMPVKYRIYSGSNYQEYDSQTNSLGFVTIYNIPKGEHKIYIEGKYLLDSKKYYSTFTVNRIK